MPAAPQEENIPKATPATVEETSTVDPTAPVAEESLPDALRPIVAALSEQPSTPSITAAHQEEETSTAMPPTAEEAPTVAPVAAIEVSLPDDAFCPIVAALSTLTPSVRAYKLLHPNLTPETINEITFLGGILKHESAFAEPGRLPERFRARIDRLTAIYRYWPPPSVSRTSEP
jgi:hypothetical protein